jgi:hypothetical protein
MLCISLAPNGSRRIFGAIAPPSSGCHPQWTWAYPEVDSGYPAEALLNKLQQEDLGARRAPLLETRAQYGLDSAEIARLARLVTDPQSVDSDRAAVNAEFDGRTVELMALYHWYRDWVESTKRFVKRKGCPAMMGLAKETGLLLTRLPTGTGPESESRALDGSNMRRLAIVPCNPTVSVV